MRTGVEIRLICIAFARRPKSCGPAKSGLPRAPSTGGVGLSGDDGVRFRPLPGRARSKPKNPLRAERRTIRCFRGDYTRALVFIAHEAADASCVRRSVRPRL